MVFLQENGQVVSTPLTPNCTATATATFDLNDTTTIIFYEQQVPMWTTLVSIGIPESVLTQSVTVGGVTLVSTTDSVFNVTFNAMGSSLYTLILNGNIIDAKSTYQFSGKPLGTFSRTPETKLAIKSLRSPRKL